MLIRNACWFGGLTLATLVISIVQAPAQTLYRTTRVLDNQGNACLGLGSCAEFPQTVVSVDARQRTTLSPKCPADHPYLVGWDAEHHEHITVAFVGASGTGQLKLVIGNNADVAGSATVSIGCSETYLRQTSLLQSASAIPTNRRALKVLGSQ